jgi:predicted methyltransferase
MIQRAIVLVAAASALWGACDPAAREAQKPAARLPAEPSSGGTKSTLPTAKHYAHRLDEESRDRWQKPEEVVALLECRPGFTVVDLGAGTGYFLRYLSEAVGPEGRILALDVERSMVDQMYERIAREQLRNVRPDGITADDPALAPRSVDRVLIVNTWHHIEDRARYATKLEEALRPGGRVLIVDFTAESPFGPSEEHRLSIDTVTSELRAAGLNVRTLEESLPHQYVVEGRVR